MEKILIDWLSQYVGTEIKLETRFCDLHYDIFDEAVTVDYIQKNFDINVNTHESWFDTVQSLVDEISARSGTHVR
jgi:hypothetical protein